VAAEWAAWAVWISRSSRFRRNNKKGPTAMPGLLLWTFRYLLIPG
jgi:hypothetical protein